MINLSKLAALAKAAPPSEPTPDSSLDKLAQEKMSRRAALRRIGMVGGMTVLGVLSIDELARVSSSRLEQYELTRGIAKDFRKAGVAFADANGYEISPNGGYIATGPSPTDGLTNDDPPVDCNGDEFCECEETWKKDKKKCGRDRRICHTTAGLFNRYCIDRAICLGVADKARKECVDNI